MKKILLLSILLVNLFSYSQKQIFESPQLTQTIKQHKIVAILPFKVKISYKKQPKNYDAQANRELELSRSKSIQSSMYTFLLRKREKYTVDFQDVEKTNILLKKAGVSDKLDEMSKDELAKILGVDAVLGGMYEAEQTRTEAGAIVSAVIFGGLGGKTGSDSLTLTLNNGKDGELLWRFYKTMSQDLMSSTDDIVDSMMRKVSRNFPYTK